MPHSSLTIVATRPFKSSNLAIPPSPFSPLYPITPPPRAAALGIGHALDARPYVPFGVSPPPPAEPLRWLWQCHICSRVYRLSVTRRCLDDGHHFCSGTTTVKRSRRSGRRALRHRACASEFDYQGWRAWGEWRRGLAAARALDAAEQSLQCARLAEDVRGDRCTPLVSSLQPGRKDCWATCDYPSECRWGKQSHASTTSTVANESCSTSSGPMTPSTPSAGTSLLPKTKFEDILAPAEVPRAEHVEVALTPPAPPPQSDAVIPPSGFDATQPSIDDLKASELRRKRRSLGTAPSPLGSHPPMPPGDSGFATESSTEPEVLVSEAVPVAAVATPTTVETVAEPPPAYLARHDAMEGLEMEVRRGRHSSATRARDDSDLEIARWRRKERRASELALGFWACVRDASLSSSSLSAMSTDSLLVRGSRYGRGRKKGKLVGEGSMF